MLTQRSTWSQVPLAAPSTLRLSGPRDQSVGLSVLETIELTMQTGLDVLLAPQQPLRPGTTYRLLGLPGAAAAFDIKVDEVTPIVGPPKVTSANAKYTKGAEGAELTLSFAIEPADAAVVAGKVWVQDERSGAVLQRWVAADGNRFTFDFGGCAGGGVPRNVQFRRAKLEFLMADGQRFSTDVVTSPMNR